MSWVNPDWFLWGAFIFCTGVHLLYCFAMTQERLTESGLDELADLGGALACLFGYWHLPV